MICNWCQDTPQAQDLVAQRCAAQNQECNITIHRMFFNQTLGECVRFENVNDAALVMEADSKAQKIHQDKSKTHCYKILKLNASNVTQEEDASLVLPVVDGAFP